MNLNISQVFALTLELNLLQKGGHKLFYGLCSELPEYNLGL